MVVYLVHSDDNSIDHPELNSELINLVNRRPGR